MKLKLLFIFILGLGVTLTASAQFLVQPDYDAQPIKPVVKGLSHPHVCVAPDGWNYLTGTVGDPKKDFENDGIYLWKSKDLNNWQELGKVFDVSEITWQKRGEPVYGTNHSKRRSGCRGAELHFIKGEYYLVYSTVYQSIGVLKSKTGDAEGPYEDWSKLLPWGYDPSLFEDEDGNVYLTWNGGYIARLSDDLKALDERPKAIIPEIFPSKGWGEYPVLDKVGTAGAHIIKLNGKYCLVASDLQHRMGTWCDDQFLSVSDGDIYGPYHRREFVVPHAAHSSIFKDREGNWWSTFAGNSDDPYAMFTGSTGLIPLVQGTRYRLKPSPKVILEKGVIGSMHPVKSVKDIFMRDPSICVGHDGAYYLVSTLGQPSQPPFGGLKMWRSTDLENWDALGYIWNWDKNATWQTNRKRDEPDRKEMLWAPEIAYINGTYWICFSHSLTPRVTSLIKSSTGLPEGPYIDPVGGPVSDGIDGFLFQDEDGEVYYLWGGGQMVKMKKDMSGFAEEPITILAGGWEKMGYEGCCLIKYKGKYILTASDHSGDHNGTYDLMYAISDNVEGPYSERRFAAGHAGHATLFQGTDNKLYCTVFGSDSHCPVHQQLGIIEVDFDEDFNFIIKDTKVGY
ncbi:family 43 glycosylhydrolase [uncultured Draconibacterium sp.]|uniref:family 43 glycosylhydrolase n=1 Tax=uncultured Draconibacterium sp. TaxID=1573823 RepID=UPI0029C81803|nr:family 43 glycosylhydrolase [uncultured Draconibacterium sp.]